jgi:glutamyl-tRNA reductase
MTDAHASEQSFAPSDTDNPNPEAVRKTIHERSEGIKRQELKRVFDRLGTHETLTERQREIITRMATAIVDGVLHAPDAALADATHRDRDTVRTAVELFDSDR